MPHKTVSAILLILIFCSCSDNGENKNSIRSNAETKTTIDIQPFTGVTDAQVNYVFAELKKNYPFISVNKPVALPSAAYYPARNRYRADSLINFLSRITIKGHKTIGLTHKDISATKNEVSDWGVMGLGFRPGKACIASTFRLSKAHTNLQLYKVAIHELGHTFGLPHCPVKSCFMRNAEGGNPTDEEKEFCKSCHAFLLSKGWQLK